MSKTCNMRYRLKYSLAYITFLIIYFLSTATPTQNIKKTCSKLFSYNRLENESGDDRSKANSETSKGGAKSKSRKSQPEDAKLELLIDLSDSVPVKQDSNLLNTNLLDTVSIDSSSSETASQSSILKPRYMNISTQENLSSDSASAYYSVTPDHGGRSPYYSVVAGDNQNGDSGSSLHKSCPILNKATRSASTIPNDESKSPNHPQIDNASLHILEDCTQQLTIESEYKSSSNPCSPTRAEFDAKLFMQSTDDVYGLHNSDRARSAIISELEKRLKNRPNIASENSTFDKSKNEIKIPFLLPPPSNSRKSLSVASFNNGSPFPGDKPDILSKIPPPPPKNPPRSCTNDSLTFFPSSHKSNPSKVNTAEIRPFLVSPSKSTAALAQPDMTWAPLPALQPIGVVQNTADQAAVSSHVDLTYQWLLQRIQERVKGATNTECWSALRKNNWDVEVAVKHVQVEQLFKLGVASRPQCEKVLQADNWNVELAGSHLIDEITRS